LQLRNPLYSIFKNYGDEALARVFPAALLLSLKRTLLLAQLDTNQFRLNGVSERSQSRLLLLRGLRTLRRRVGRFAGPADKVTGIPAVAAADLVGYQDLLTDFPKLVMKRAAIQQRRRRADTAIFPLFREPFWPAEQASRYQTLLVSVRDFFLLNQLFCT